MNVAELMVWLSDKPAGARVYLRLGDVTQGELQAATMDDLSVVLKADQCDVFDAVTGESVQIR